MTFDPRGLEVREGGKNVYTRYLKELEQEQGAVLAPRDVAEDIQDRPVLVVNNIAEKVTSAEYFKNRNQITTQFVTNLQKSSAEYSALLAQGQEGPMVEGPMVEELVRNEEEDTSLDDPLTDLFSNLTLGEQSLQQKESFANKEGVNEENEVDQLSEMLGRVSLN